MTQVRQEQAEQRPMSPSNGEVQKKDTRRESLRGMDFADQEAALSPGGTEPPPVQRKASTPVVQKDESEESESGGAPPEDTAPPPTAAEGDGADNEMFDPSKHSAAMAGPQSVEAKATAAKLRPQMEATAAEERTANQKLTVAIDEVEEKLKTATGDEAAALTKQKTTLKAQHTKSQAQLKELDADLTALDDPTFDDAKANQILAHQKAFVKTEATTTVDTHEGIEANPLKKQETTVTSSYDKGTATVTTDDSKTSLGAGGLKNEKSQTTEKTGADGSSSKDSEKRDIGVGLDGFTYKKDEAHEETDAEGKTKGDGSGTEIKVGPKGASYTTKESEKDDKSSTEKEKTVGVERGDGKVGGARESKSTVKGEDKSETKTSHATKGGLSSGEDGVGAYAEHESKTERKTEGGMKTGAVGGLTGGVNVNVKEVKDSDPKKYQIIISIDVGLSAGLDAGGESEGKGSAGVGVKAKGSGKFATTHTLDEAGATAYLERLKASNNGAATGPEKEMAILAALKSQGADGARRVIDGAQATMGDAESLEKMVDGDKQALTAEGSVGAEANAKGEGGGGTLGIKGGYEVGKELESSVEKKGDKYVFEKKVGDSEKISGGAEIGVGVVSGGMGMSHKSKSARGYKFEIDPKDEHYDAGSDKFVVGFTSISAELGAANSQEALDAFAAKYPWTVTEKVTTKGTEDGTDGSIGIGGAKVELAYGTAYEEETTEGKEGTSHKYTGSSSGGMKVGKGDNKIGSSSKEEAVAEVDAEGNASVDVSETDTETNMAGWVGQRVPEWMGGTKDERSTAQKVAGTKKAKTEDTHVEGVKAESGELAVLVQALKDGKWMTKCSVPRLMDTWKEAGEMAQAEGGSEAAVAKAIAWYTGHAGIGAEDTVEQAIRGKDGTGGKGYEFPEGLGHLRKPYGEVVLGDPKAKIEAAVKAGGAAKGIEAGKAIIVQLESLYVSVQSGQSKFENIARYGEMIDSITRRKGEVEGQLRELNGGKADELTPEEWKKHYNDLLGDCQNFKNQEDNFYGKMDAIYEQWHPDIIEIEKYRSQLRELYARWKPKYEEMAGVAQEHNYGEGIYFRFQPDMGRWTKAASGPPGPKNEPAEEKRDLKKKPEEKVVTAPKDPVGDSWKENEKQGKALANATQTAMNTARNRAAGAGNNLFKKIQGDKKSGAIDAHNRGMALTHNADKQLGKLGKGASEDDWNSYGAIARDDYTAALAAFQEGLAMY